MCITIFVIDFLVCKLPDTFSLVKLAKRYNMILFQFFLPTCIMFGIGTMSREYIRKFTKPFEVCFIHDIILFTS